MMMMTTLYSRKQPKRLSGSFSFVVVSGCGSERKAKTLSFEPVLCGSADFCDAIAITELCAASRARKTTPTNKKKMRGNETQSERKKIGATYFFFSSCSSFLRSGVAQVESATKNSNKIDLAISKGRIFCLMRRGPFHDDGGCACGRPNGRRK